MNSSIHCKLELSQDNLNDLYGFFIVQAIIMLICSPPTIILNLLILVGVYKTPSLHSPSNILLCGLALTDLGAGAIAMPSLAVESISYVLNSPALTCGIKLVTFSIVTPFSGISLVTLTLVSFDRLLALHLHLRYNQLVTNQRIIYCLVAVWIIGFFIASSTFWYVALLEWTTVLIFVSCLVISSFNNLVIIKILHRHRVAIEHQQQQVNVNAPESETSFAKDRKTSRTMRWIYVLFLVCYIPFLAVRILRNFKGKNTKVLFASFEVTFSLMYLNSLLNPILYCIKMQSVRKGMIRAMPKKIRSALHLSGAE